MFYSKNKVYACKSRCQPTPHPPRTSFLASFLILYILYGENPSSGFCEQQGTDQPAHTRSLISAFVITGTVAEQAGLNLTLSEDRVSHAHIYFTNFPHLYFASISPVF